jgi:hypothetical protein
MTRPSFITSVRCEMSRATPRSWVTMITARPSSVTSERIRSSRRACTDTSSPLVGSSMNTRRGDTTRLRAICKRCRMPPEKVTGASSMRSTGISTRSSHSAAAVRTRP